MKMLKPVVADCLLMKHSTPLLCGFMKYYIYITTFIAQTNIEKKKKLTFHFEGFLGLNQIVLPKKQKKIYVGLQRTTI